MPRIAAVLTLVAVLAVAAPAQAQEVPTVLQPCTNTAGAEVVTLEGLVTGIATPTNAPLWLEGTQKTFVLDLAGNPVEDSSAIVDITMTWDIPVEDYDLNMLDHTGTEVDHSENINPVDATDENVSGTVAHCKRFSAEALAWTAIGLSTLTLTITAS